MDNYFYAVTQKINNPIYKKQYDKFNRYKNEPLNLNYLKSNIYVHSLPKIKE